MGFIGRVDLEVAVVVQAAAVGLEHLDQAKAEVHGMNHRRVVLALAPVGEGAGFGPGADQQHADGAALLLQRMQAEGALRGLLQVSMRPHQ